MAGERQVPGLNLNIGWTPGSNDYAPTLNDNFRKLSAVGRGSVASRTTEYPASPTPGDEDIMYILPSGSAGTDNAVVMWDEDLNTGTPGWVEYYPQTGWVFYVEDDGEFVVFISGTGWTPLADLIGVAGGGNVDVNTQEGTAYTAVAGDFDGRTIVWMNNAASNILTVPAGLTVSKPMQVVMAGAGQTSLLGDVGVTFYAADNALDLRVQYSVASVIPIAADEYLIVGDLFDASA